MTGEKALAIQEIDKALTWARENKPALYLAGYAMLASTNTPADADRLAAELAEYSGHADAALAYLPHETSADGTLRAMIDGGSAWLRLHFIEGRTGA